jgi:hypothetical protein
MLVINEFLANPDAVADNQGEWLEIYNPNTYAIDMRGFVLREPAPQIDNHTINSGTPVIVPAGGYVVLGNSATKTTNGGVDVAYQYSSFVLGNTNDEIILIANGVELDRFDYPASFTPDGISYELSRNHRTSTLNNNTANWCRVGGKMPLALSRSRCCHCT